MSSGKLRDVAVLTAATGLTRFAFRSHYLYDIDSVNFALALKRFDPGAYQPHPPGYFLYVGLGRLVNLIFHDANTALVAISIFFSCAAVAAIYVLTENWFGRSAASFAALIFLCSPLAWFHGTVALTYIVEAFFSASVGYLCWRVYGGAGRFVLPAAMLLGVAAGFRPSSLLFLGPLFLFSLGGVGSKPAVGGIGALVLTVVAWLAPMIRISGAKSYISSLVSLWLTVPAKGSVFNSSVANSVVRAFVVAGIYFLCFGCAALLPAWRPGTSDHGDRRKTLFTRVWIAPGLLFFTFVFLKFVNSGYLLILMPPICAWLGLRAAEWYRHLRVGRPLKMLSIAGCAAVNTAIFLWAPFYFSYREVRLFEAELRNIIATLPRVAPPGETMIVGFDSHFLGYRQAGYYLPEYLTVQFPEVRLGAGTSVFAMFDRDTGVKSRLVTTSIRNFVFFPLPSDDTEYSEYVAGVLRRLPAQDLRLISRGGHEYVMGPIRDLPLLFPASAPEALAAARGSAR